MFGGDESDYRKIQKKMEDFDNKKLGELPIANDLQKIRKSGSLVSYDFNSFYPSAQADKDSTWPATETAYPFRKYMGDTVCEIFNSGRWNDLNRSASIIKYDNPKNIIFQHVLIREKTNNPYKEKYINHSRNAGIIDTLNSADIVEIVKRRAVILEVHEGFFCHNMQNNPYTEFVHDMVGNRDLYKEQGRLATNTI